MEYDESAADGELPVSSTDGGGGTDGEESSSHGEAPELLAVVRYGLGKELRLYHDEFAVVNVETGEDLRLRLSNIRRLILAPGEQVPSKLVLMFDLDDGNTIIAAEGMSNVKDFRKLLAQLTALRPDLELDPPNMDEQLAQALEIHRRSLLGCYGAVLVACVILWLVYMAVAMLPHVFSHTTH
jgi:hypothetical protein